MAHQLLLLQDNERKSEPNVQGQEPGSSSTTSTSSGSKPTRAQSPSHLLSPVASSRKKKSPSTQIHSSASRNIQNRPPVSSSKAGAHKDDGNMYKLDHVGRSASTREFRALNQRKHLGYAVDDQAM